MTLESWSYLVAKVGMTAALLLLGYALVVLWAAVYALVKLVRDLRRVYRWRAVRREMGRVNRDAYREWRQR
jgi:hypothetical protein